MSSYQLFPNLTADEFDARVEPVRASRAAIVARSESILQRGVQRWLLARFPHDQIVREWKVPGGRVDVAMLREGHPVILVEVKWAADAFDGLPQLVGYGAAVQPARPLLALAVHEAYVTPRLEKHASMYGVEVWPVRPRLTNPTPA